MSSCHPWLRGFHYPGVQKVEDVLHPHLSRERESSRARVRSLRQRIDHCQQFRYDFNLTPGTQACLWSFWVVQDLTRRTPKTVGRRSGLCRLHPSCKPFQSTSWRRLGGSIDGKKLPDPAFQDPAGGLEGHVVLSYFNACSTQGR